jgi:hypothetical protein
VLQMNVAENPQSQSELSMFAGAGSAPAQ